MVFLATCNRTIGGLNKLVGMCCHRAACYTRLSSLVPLWQMLKRRGRDLGERSLLSHGLHLFEAHMKAGRREKALAFWNGSAVSRCAKRGRT